MSQSFVRKEAPDHLDRRHLLRYLGASMAALAVPGSLAAVAGPAGVPGPDPCGPPSGLPYHLSILDLRYPDAVVPNAHQIALLSTTGKPRNLFKPIDQLITKNRALFKKSVVVKKLAERVRNGNPPKTAQEMLLLFRSAWSLPSLCIAGPDGGCIDTGCDTECIVRGAPGGECFSIPFDVLEEDCSCACSPPWYEFALLALILLLLFATPGPDEIPAILAAISRLIIRRAPVPVP